MNLINELDTMCKDSFLSEMILIIPAIKLLFYESFEMYRDFDGFTEMKMKFTTMCMFLFYDAMDYVLK